jgi:hypothetical protein
MRDECGKQCSVARTMDRRIAELNIEHLERKLGEVADPQLRETILRLIAEEKAKLAELKRRNSGNRHSA